MRRDYDLLVIGSGRAGQETAIQGAKLGRKVAIVEREPALGGVSANTGTIPSKTARAAILDRSFLSGQSDRGLASLGYGRDSVADQLGARGDSQLLEDLA